jgi:hypothetical protein
MVYRPGSGATTPVLEPMAQLNIGADFKFVAPEGDKLRGHISGRDPVSGKVAFRDSLHQSPAAREPAVHRRQRAVRA